MNTLSLSKISEIHLYKKNYTLNVGEKKFHICQREEKSLF
jgi:hypothetical protein